MRIIPINSTDDVVLATKLSSDDASWYLDKKMRILGLTAGLVRRVRTPEGAIKYKQPIGTIIFDKSTWDVHYDDSGLEAGWTLVDEESDHTLAVQRSAKSGYSYAVYNHETGAVLGVSSHDSVAGAKKSAVSLLNAHIIKKSQPKAKITAAPVKEQAASKPEGFKSDIDPVDAAKLEFFTQLSEGASLADAVYVAKDQIHWQEGVTATKVTALYNYIKNLPEIDDELAKNNEELSDAMSSLAQLQADLSKDELATLKAKSAGEDESIPDSFAQSHYTLSKQYSDTLYYNPHPSDAIADLQYTVAKNGNTFEDIEALKFIAKQELSGDFEDAGLLEKILALEPNDSLDDDISDLLPSTDVHKSKPVEFKDLEAGDTLSHPTAEGADKFTVSEVLSRGIVMHSHQNNSRILFAKSKFDTIVTAGYVVEPGKNSSSHSFVEPKDVIIANDTFYYAEYDVIKVTQDAVVIKLRDADFEDNPIAIQIEDFKESISTGAYSVKKAESEPPSSSTFEETFKSVLPSATAPSESKDATAPSSVSEPETLPPQQFVKGKMMKLGEVVVGTKKGDPEHNAPKKTMADGIIPTVGMQVISSKEDKDGVIVETLQTHSRVQHPDGKRTIIPNSKLNKKKLAGNSSTPTDVQHFANPNQVWNQGEIYSEDAEVVKIHELDYHGNSELLPPDHPNYKAPGSSPTKVYKHAFEVPKDKILDVKQWSSPKYYPGTSKPNHGELAPGGKVKVEDPFNGIDGFYIVKEHKSLDVKSSGGGDITISAVTVVDPKTKKEYDVRLKDVYSYKPPKSFYTEDEEKSKKDQELIEKPKPVLTEQVTTMHQLKEQMTSQERLLFDSNAKQVTSAKNQSRFPKLSKTVFNALWPVRSSSDMHEATFSISSHDTKKKVIAKVKEDNPGMTESQVYDALHSIKAYSGSSYGPINVALRSKSKPSKSVQDKIDNIDKIINSVKTDKDMTVYRLSKLDPENFLPGDVFEDLGYMSTTILSDSSKFHGVAGINSEYGTTFEILVPAGTHGVYLGSASGVPSEKEFLVGRGHRFKVLYNNNKHVILQLIPKGKAE